MISLWRSAERQHRLVPAREFSARQTERFTAFSCVKHSVGSIDDADLELRIGASLQKNGSLMFDEARIVHEQEIDVLAPLQHDANAIGHE